MLAWLLGKETSRRMLKPPAKYRCAKCNHRVGVKDASCGHCGWNVDLIVARSAAKHFKRRRRRYYWLQFVEGLKDFGRMFLGKKPK